MILNRVVNGDTIKGFYESSNIMASEYNTGTKELTIVFNYGGKYKYNDVTLTDFTRFEMADSQGVVLNSHIKDKYVYENLGKVDVKVLKEEFEKLKKEESETLKKELVEYCREFVKDWDDVGIFSKPKLNKIKEAIDYSKDKIK